VAHRVGRAISETPASEFANITVEQALNHPTWKNGTPHYYRFGHSDE